MKSYTLWVHFKQGDDLNALLNQSESPQEALITWAEALENGVKNVRRLAELFKDKKLEIEADTHSIYVSGDAESIKQSVKEEILNEEEFEEEEEFENEDVEC